MEMVAEGVQIMNLLGLLYLHSQMVNLPVMYIYHLRKMEKSILIQLMQKQIIPMSPAEHLTSMIHESGKSLSINNLPLELTTDISFDLDVMLLTPNDEGYETQSEQVTMTWDVSDLPEGISLSLVNNGTGQTVNLYGYPSMNVALPSKGGFSFPENLMETYPEVGESQFTLSVYTDIASNDDEEYAST